MEVLIERFLSVSHGNGDGCGNGNGYGHGYGCGNGNGYGHGYGDGSGDGSGNGYGDGCGGGYSSDYGDGCGDGIAEINGLKVYDIDSIPTIIESIHGNYAKGYTIKYNTILVPCFIAKCGDCFAHGNTLHDAQVDAEAKYIKSIPVGVRISNTTAKYPTLDTIVPNRELFNLHNLLTGSCRFGREQFCTNHSISLDDSMTMQEFINCTRNDYGGNVIIQLEMAYKAMEK